ncbi:hypothetical protein FRB96_001456 [Tulasnella sp. 330]|nr:hypothetical protein FRB96_001456 [Tulasnella sp. 330]KAG8878753.1 hypothetical protein FRB98_006011 [Tulasnella sp. 332]
MTIWIPRQGKYLKNGSTKYVTVSSLAGGKRDSGRRMGAATKVATPRGLYAMDAGATQTLFGLDKIPGPALLFGLSDTLKAIKHDAVERTSGAQERLDLENAKKDCKCPTRGTGILVLQRCIKKSTKYYHIACAEIKFFEGTLNIAPAIKPLDYGALELWEA